MVARVEEWEAAGLLYEVDDGVAWLRLNRPQKRNAIDRPLRNALLAAIHEVSEDPTVKVAVVTANGSAFSSGADLTQEGGPLEVPPERRRPAPNTARDDGILYGWYRLMEAIWHSETPFIAAVNGVAAGGGCQLALACDLILASEEASFWEVFVRRGLPLEGGGAWILPRAVSLVRAKELALFGEPLPARRAEEWGLINRCVPAGELEDTAREWARKLATLAAPASGPSSPGAPQGGRGPDLSVRVGHIKSQLNQSLEATMYQTFRDEVTLLSLGPGLPPH
ncbi:MAG TPA: enoyl-CoA hydratase/isomerase family protein [Acidimicrobiales bacterium]|nr:enoyl-CoA hydratase/isomerase family protein [Acidimicrobiales bacterium]